MTDFRAMTNTELVSEYHKRKGIIRCGADVLLWDALIIELRMRRISMEKKVMKVEWDD